MAPRLAVGLLPQSCTTGVQWVQTGPPCAQLQSFLGTHQLLAAALQPLAARAAWFLLPLPFPFRTPVVTAKYL